jgi:DNA polymerase-1
VAVAADGHDEFSLIDGDSLAYGAFFTLPESIAASTAFRPTRSSASRRCS